MSPGTPYRIGSYCQVILVNLHPSFICVKHVSHHCVGGRKFQHILCKAFLRDAFLALHGYFTQSVCVATPINVLDAPQLPLCCQGIGEIYIQGAAAKCPCSTTTRSSRGPGVIIYRATIRISTIDSTSTS